MLVENVNNIDRRCREVQKDDIYGDVILATVFYKPKTDMKIKLLDFEKS